MVNVTRNPFLMGDWNPVIGEVIEVHITQEEPPLPKGTKGD
jgi:hypothetical protein